MSVLDDLINQSISAPTVETGHSNVNSGATQPFEINVPEDTSLGDAHSRDLTADLFWVFSALVAYGIYTGRL